VSQFIRSIAVLLLSACLMQGAWAQFNVSGPGFLPDENGTNLDDPHPKKVAPKVAAGTIIKDCAECPKMVVIPAGSFVMGSEKSANEKPIHSVAIRSFLLGKNEVTQKQWLDVMGSNPSRFLKCGDNCPIDNVEWKEVNQFITKLNQKTGQKYRLPSEAEWEYAARAGTTSEWYFGNDESKVGNYAWHDGNSGSKTQLVAQKPSNAFGLFDMHGNVWELTEDCFHENYVGAPTDGSAWTTVCTDNRRVLRGGSWFNSPANLRSAVRNWDFPVNGGVLHFV
jgi:formylglycine-generating enzyme required for sulfatase activity